MKSKQHRLPVRIIITAIILLLEIYLLFLTVTHFSEQRVWVYSAAEFISILTVFSIINKRGNSSYKIMWIIFILLVPLFGVVSYLLWGGGRVFPHIRRNLKKVNDKYKKFLPDDIKTLSRLNYEDMIHSRQAEFIRREAEVPVYDGTKSEFFAPCENLMPTLIDELKKAKKYIYLEFFILAEGSMWDEIFAVLKEKASQGVEIKIIFDDFGSIKTQSKNFVKTLCESGIEVSSFNPIVPSINIFMNNRDHRKIIIIDGETAFTGGFNIADEYINRIERFGYWMDSCIMLKGAAVTSFLYMFASMWEFTTGKHIDLESRISKRKYENDGFYMPYPDDPLDDKNPAAGVYLQILNNAQKYVYIATPYLILDSALSGALCLAAKSGVDVKIVTPAIPDKWYVHPVTQYYYSELLAAGVEIYEYTPGFIHSKIFLSDDSVATVGTINTDYRSLYLHFECGVWMCGTGSVKTIKENFEDILSVSEKIDPVLWNKRPLWQKFKQYILHLFAPFM